MNHLDRIYTKDIEQFSLSYFDYLKKVIDRVDLSEIKHLITEFLSARERGSTIYFIGNGGSAATASHFANDLSYGTNDYIKPFKVMSLTDNVAILTALGNDYGFDDIFASQLKIHAKKDDVLVGISASGNSQNLINAFEYASSIDVKTFALTAFDGGKLKKISEHCIHVPTEINEYGPAEDVHMILDHLIGSYLMRYIKLE
jgi:D-sedoheptulose 7-phosphate isomerase